ncbi:hypothetical protein T4E_2611 [Trichinella pseudospiralis]|uniref:Uncharacterized protein n=1 Tax=Trichinella pseudospiralis TaxID=6337 RepID=A0A0V0Y6K3_TRIPS|nr:hypothetical protein T4E_2611 [Trichinella pseudospiralis]
MGDVLQFETFWEHFEDQIHRQSELRDTTRFSYLRSCLTGNALNAIDGLTVTAANYSAAIEVLKSRFSRRDLIIQSHIRKLLCVMSCNDQPLETSRKFYDEVVLHIRALEALGENPSLPELIASEVLLILFKLKMEESISMIDDKPSSNVTFMRKKSPPRKRLPSAATLHAETRSYEDAWCLENVIEEIGALKPSDVIIHPIRRCTTNCCTNIERKEKMNELREDEAAERFWDEHRQRMEAYCRQQERSYYPMMMGISWSQTAFLILTVELFQRSESDCQKSLIGKDLAGSLRLKEYPGERSQLSHISALRPEDNNGGCEPIDS